MGIYMRRCHCSRKQQITVFVGILCFITYYTFHLGAVERTAADLDATGQIKFETIQLSKAQPNTVDKEQKNHLNALESNPTLQQDAPKQSITSLHGIGASFRLPQSNITKIPIKKPDLKKRDSIVKYIEETLLESLKEDKGTGCDIPQLDPFAPEIMKFYNQMPEIVCSGHDWVKCYFSTCKLHPKLIKLIEPDGNKLSVECTYNDILFESDNKYVLGPPAILKGNEEYILNRSDHVKINCKFIPDVLNDYWGSSWVGLGIGYRPLKPEKPPPGRENTYNVLIFGYDSTSKNGFIRKMPKSYKFITEELNAVVLDRYNIVGDGTPAALFPLLTGKTELELPESRRSMPNTGYLDVMPFIFYKLKKDGYRTSYFEDSPHVGTFQYRFHGFRHQPTDHYLRAFCLEADKNRAKGKLAQYCVGDTPQFKIMMNITDQFLKLDGKRFAFTFIADITHDNFNMISNADAPFVDFLRGLDKKGMFKDTLLIVMGDHGSRYNSDLRQTYQGKMEERLPLMAIRLPDNLKTQRPEAFNNLISNVDTLTTIHDVHATILDVIDMKESWNSYKIKGADLTRGMTLLETIPKNRSCSEAGIEPHWCTCLKWEAVTPDEPVYQRAAQALLDHINHIIQFQRSKCAVRTLTSIDWVTKKRTNTKVLQFQGVDSDGYVGKFGAAIALNKNIYQVKITVGPGIGVYEAAVTHLVKDDKFTVFTRDISRINAYNKEPECISAVYPHLNMFCYCCSNC